ncbi:MAG TPA: hypothetical protein VEA41_22600 [Salinarimonas sp.]|nr:hypothetical protein [Salinarimonas sp.]
MPTDRKHTPTPWHIGTENPTDLYAWLPIPTTARLTDRDRVDAITFHVASANVDRTLPYAEKLANADIIARAVNAHEDLVRAAERLLISRDPRHPDWYPGMDLDAVAELREALAKANGSNQE